MPDRGYNPKTSPITDLIPADAGPDPDADPDASALAFIKSEGLVYIPGYGYMSAEEAQKAGELPEDATPIEAEPLPEPSLPSQRARQ